MDALLVLLVIVGGGWFAVLVFREYQRRKAEDDLQEALPRMRSAAAEGSSHDGQLRERIGRTDEAISAPPTMAAPPIRETARWLGAGMAAEVQGYVLPGGLLYVGQVLPPVVGYGREPALVDPSLPVDSNSPDRVGAAMPYWPSYDGLSPQCRAAYLEWLASGRRAPDVGIGYVFLFLYGLERRALLDASQSDEAKADLPAIRQEVIELLMAYGSNGSFERYATQLVEVLDVAMGNEGEPALPAARRSYDLPLGLRVGLGKVIAAEQPIPAARALAWLLHHPEADLRTPSRRCAAEFRALFLTRYAHEFGAGLIIKAPRGKLVASIQPASASFGGAITFALDLPDIARLSAPLGKLQGLADSCQSDLDAYSRWLGRNPNAQKTLAAVALLPKELVASHESPEVRELWQWIADLLKGNSVAFCNGEELLKRCASLWDEKLTKAEAVLLAQLLQKGGYGIEPDVRFGGGLLTAGDVAAMFQLEPDAPSAPSAGYAPAAILLHLGVAVSASDGSISVDERQQLEEHVEQSLALSDPERRRLSMHLSWLMRSTPRLTGLKKRLEPLDAGQRALIADLVVNVAGVDAQLAPAELKTIGKIFGLLGISEETVYARLHAVATGGLPEVLPRVMEGVAETGFAIPQPPKPSSGMALDMNVVAAKIAQSASVAAILSEVFTDDSDIPLPMPRMIPTSAGGLSPAYTALLKQLRERIAWTREEFEALARQQQLLPDAAIEVLNDTAFERCGRAVLEGDDPLQLESAVLKELVT